MPSSSALASWQRARSWSTLIFGLYLSALVLRLPHQHGCSALGIEDFKASLRFKLTKGGRTLAHFIAMDEVPKRWEEPTLAAHLLSRCGPAVGATVKARVDDHLRFSGFTYVDSLRALYISNRCSLRLPSSSWEPSRHRS